MLLTILSNLKEFGLNTNISAIGELIKNDLHTSLKSILQSCLWTLTCGQT